jgi:hypothetical protein
MRKSGAKISLSTLYLVQAHVVPPVVKLGGPCGGVVRHDGGSSERAAVLQIGRDVRRPERVVACLRLRCRRPQRGGRSWRRH